MPVCEVYECFSEIIGIPLPQLAAWASISMLTLAAALTVVFRIWKS